MCETHGRVTKNSIHSTEMVFIIIKSNWYLATIKKIENYYKKIKKKEQFLGFQYHEN